MFKNRKIIPPTPEEDAAINRGIAADPDTYELSSREIAELLEPTGREEITISEKRYVILELSDAKALALNASAGFDERVVRTIDRIEAETGADIEDIVTQLKHFEACPACVIEGQERSCCAWHAQKLGRRLSRLLDRANGIAPKAD
jgi:hypothetical protein